MSWHRFILAVSILLSASYCVAQPPDTQKSEPPRSEGSVPLRQIPWSNSQAIVVTDDLKKALDALGASSVVISAERYREIMNQIKQLSQPAEKGPAEFLFASCLISGEVKQQSGRDVVELHFELQCRTDAPNTYVPLPFKGLRFASATVNDQVPLWGPDPEHLSVLIAQPQAVKLQLTAFVPLTRLGNERRLTFGRIPSATITMLDLTVPGQARQAFVRGYGSINITQTNNQSHLQANALGVLAVIDLSWQVAEPTISNAPPAIESDIQISLDDTSAQIEVKMTRKPLEAIQLPWRLRLPAQAAQIQAELTRPESTISEPLLVTKSSDGTVLLSSPNLTTVVEYTHVLLRWKQALPEADSKEKVILGTCEVVSPAGRQQNGMITVFNPEDTSVMLHPVNLNHLAIGASTSPELPTPESSLVRRRNATTPEREGKRTARYRFTAQPAGLEAIPLPRSITRGVVEIKLQHILSVHDGAWTLLTDLEVTRSARANPTTFELFWPADWTVNRKILFSSVVKEMEQDQANQRLRIFLEGKQPGSFTLHLESAPTTSAHSINLNLPYLTGVQGLQANRSVLLEVVLQQERLRLESRSWNLKVEPGSMGLQEEGDETLASRTFETDSYDKEKTSLPNVSHPTLPSGGGGQGGAVTKTKLLQITNHPATLSASKEPRLPHMQCRVEAYLDPILLQTRQTFEIKWDGPVPRQLQLLVPRVLKQVRFATPASDSGASQSLHISNLSAPENDLWDRYLLDIPDSPTDPFIFISSAMQEHQMGTVTIPLIRPVDGQTLQENQVVVSCLGDRRLEKMDLPDELPGWSVISKPGQDEKLPSLELQGTALNHLLALQLTICSSDLNSSQAHCSIQSAYCEIYHLGNGVTSCRFSWHLDDITSSRLFLSIPRPFDRVKLKRCVINDELSSCTLEWNQEKQCTQMKLTLQPHLLLQQAEIKVELTLIDSALISPWLTAIPNICWGSLVSAGQLYPQTWRIHADPTDWLLYSNQAQDPLFVRSAWLPHQTGAQDTYQFQTLDNAVSLFVLKFPRVAVILVLSCLSFFLVKRRRKKQSGEAQELNGGGQPLIGETENTRSRSISLLFSSAPFLLFVTLVVGFLFVPVALPALAWGALPGIIAATLMIQLDRFLKEHLLRQPRVFRTSTDHAIEIHPDLEKLPRSFVLAHTPTMMTKSRSSMH